ncbi:MAG: hypothetical protein LBT10_07780 [Methanobrevibacter sp.]|jgi:predicted membrane channel-forming protein YqfA (hemolysin III family)|nr:hypothetical protein [Methanobrevibacter sp.]
MDFGVNVTMIFSHILPAILGFLGFLLMINGIMDRHKYITIVGVGIFIIAAFIPFIVLPFLLH